MIARRDNAKGDKDKLILQFRDIMISFNLVYVNLVAHNG